MENLEQIIQTLKSRIKLLERITNFGLVGIGIAFLVSKHAFLPPLIVLCLVAQIVKSITRKKLKQKEYLAKEIEEHTQQIRSERDAVQEESQKLAVALEELAETQDELVRQEKMATVGQLTKGVVDRILNPLNYINNFSNLTSSLIHDLRSNLEGEREHISKEVYDDSVELLGMMSGNLEKITEHGYNTVRIVKAMEELLKDRRGNITLTDINNLCRIAIDKIKKSYAKEIEENHIRIQFEGLTLSVMMEVNMEQLGNVWLGLLKNAIYAVCRKAEKETFAPEVSFRLCMNKDKLEVRIRDNGTGIDESIQDKIFAPFFTTKPTSEASGVGLYLCREVIQNHRGTIEVDSKKGEYTEFLATIPVYQTPRPIIQNKEEE